MASAANGVPVQRATPTVNTRLKVPSASMTYLSSVRGVSRSTTGG